MLGNEVLQVEFQPTCDKMQVGHPGNETDTEGCGLCLASKCKKAICDVGMMMVGCSAAANYRTTLAIAQQYERSLQTYPQLNA